VAKVAACTLRACTECTHSESELTRRTQNPLAPSFGRCPRNARGKQGLAAKVGWKRRFESCRAYYGGWCSLLYHPCTA
jgi:hypothetical protein